MKSLNGAAVVAAWGALVMAALAHAQETDCNVNGIPDAAEIAADLVEDCNGNGIPDPCEYAGTWFGAYAHSFHEGTPVSITVPDVQFAASDVRLILEAKADLDAPDEYVSVFVGDELYAQLWSANGVCGPPGQTQTLIVPRDLVNAAIASTSGSLTITLAPSDAVGIYECQWLSDGRLIIEVEYIRAVDAPDCLANGTWDDCDRVSDPNLDCDGNGRLDACEMIDAAGVDCDGDGVLDACAISSGLATDCNSNGRPDSCEIVPGQYFDADCDSNGIPDDCQIGTDSSLDANGDGMLDACQLSRGDLNLDLNVNSADLSMMLVMWGTDAPHSADLSGDGVVDGQDLGILLLHWGPYLAPWGVVLEIHPAPSVVTDPGLRAAIVATGLPWRVRDTASQIELLLVPPGTFMMGCSPSLQSVTEWQPTGCYEEEHPVHQVTLTQPFYLGRYEVTQDEWVAVMASNPSRFQEPSAGIPITRVPDRPVERVSWSMVQDFELLTGLRLPTEAEWEYACRAGTTTALYDGSDDGMTVWALAWFLQNSALQTRPVGQKQANQLGFHDMIGNVYEWTEDWFGSYSRRDAVDPQGPIVGQYRTIRGLSWGNQLPDCRVSTRWLSDSEPGGSGQWGLRMARSP